MNYGQFFIPNKKYFSSQWLEVENVVAFLVISRNEKGNINDLLNLDKCTKYF